jgi:hypothetical protein
VGVRYQRPKKGHGKGRLRREPEGQGAEPWRGKARVRRLGVPRETWASQCEVLNLVSPSKVLTPPASEWDFIWKHSLRCN